MRTLKVASRPTMIQIMVFLLIFIWPPIHAETVRVAPTVTAVQLTEWLKPLMQFQAYFVQQTFDELGVLKESSEGHMSIARPGRFRWNYSTPFEQIILADGRQFWIYDIDMEQITVRPLDKKTDSLPSLLLSGEVDEILEMFDITAKTIKEEVRLERSGQSSVLELLELRLVPVEKTAGMQMIRLRLAQPDLHPVDLVIIDDFDRSTQFLFSDYRWLESNELDRFEMQIPEGVDVVGHPQ